MTELSFIVGLKSAVDPFTRKTGYWQEMRNLAVAMSKHSGNITGGSQVCRHISSDDIVVANWSRSCPLGDNASRLVHTFPFTSPYDPLFGFHDWDMFNIISIACAGGVSNN